MLNKELFKDLIDRQLSSVEFIQDYLSLHFDGIILTYYLWPIVTVGKEYLFENVDYKNKLCELISKKVAIVNFEEGNNLELQFQNKSKINLTIRRFNKNSNLSEFLYYRDGGDKWFVLD